MKWIDWFLASLLSDAALAALLAGTAYLARNLIKSSIEKGIQHRFDQKIEKLRAELRVSEEALKSDLRSKEAEIAALRGGALSGLANRQALLDKRRLEAVDEIWSAIIDLAPAKVISAQITVIKFEAASREAEHNPKVREMFQSLGKTFDLTKMERSSAAKQQPFVTPMAWALFSAYQAIVFVAVGKMEMLKIGISSGTEFFDLEAIKNLLKAALPDQTRLIDQMEASSYHYLLDLIEKKLLCELKKLIEGADIDQASVVQAAKIMAEVKKVMPDNTNNPAKGAVSEAAP